jgi:hypothetical protein
MVHERFDRMLGLADGALAGLVAWLVAQAVMVVITVAGGPDLLLGTKEADAPYLVPRWMKPELESFLVPIAVLCHLGLAVGWGALFGALFLHGLSSVAMVAAGTVWGMLAWRGMYDFVYPAVGVLPVTARAPPWVAAGLYVLYGVGVALTLLVVGRRDGSGSPSIEARASRRRDTAA